MVVTEDGMLRWYSSWQLEKDSMPMVCRLLGSSTDFSWMHCAKAEDPIEVIELGRVTDWRDGQLAKMPEGRAVSVNGRVMVFSFWQP